MGKRTQVGAVPYRRGKRGQLEVLLISTFTIGWAIPKGNQDNGYSPHEAAALEALEEAGAVGQVEPREIGRFSYDKWGSERTVRVFPMRVLRMLSIWDEKDSRERRWLPINKAIKAVESPELAKILRALARRKGRRLARA